MNVDQGNVITEGIMPLRRNSRIVEFLVQIYCINKIISRGIFKGGLRHRNITLKCLYNLFIHERSLKYVFEKFIYYKG